MKMLFIKANIYHFDNTIDGPWNGQLKNIFSFFYYGIIFAIRFSSISF